MNEKEAFEVIKKELDEKYLPSNMLGKYRTLEQAKMYINNQKLYFANFEQFNDPFESNYQMIIPPYTKLGGEQVVKKAIDNMHNAATVLCLSAAMDSMLMWSHYADKHKGVLLVFDILKAPEDFMVPATVVYPRSNKFPIINPAVNIKETVEPMRYKYYGWNHEKEVRIIRYDGEAGLKEINPLALTEIRFGCRVSEKEIEEMKNMVLKSGLFPNCKFQRCILGDVQYKICFTEC